MSVTYPIDCVDIYNYIGKPITTVYKVSHNK